MLFNKNIALALAFAPLAAASSLRAVSFVLISAVLVHVSLLKISQPMHALFPTYFLIYHFRAVL